MKKKTDDLDELIKRVTAMPMTDEERREQAASFAFGNIALTKEWANKSEEELNKLRRKLRRMSGCHAPTCKECKGLGYTTHYETGTWSTLERYTLDCASCEATGKLY